MARLPGALLEKRSCDDIPGAHGPHCAPCIWHVWKQQLPSADYRTLAEYYARLAPFACKSVLGWWGGAVLQLPKLHCFWRWRHECYQLDEVEREELQACASFAFRFFREQARWHWPNLCEGGR